MFMTIAIISHSDCLLHNMGPFHPEQAARVQVIGKQLKQSGLSQILKNYQAPLVKENHLLAVHSKEHINNLFHASPARGIIDYAPDVYMNPYSLTAALRAAGSAILGVDLVLNQEVNQAFCNVRPPGHHAERGNAMGFCFFNNVAIAVSYALEHYQLKRIAIVDFDVHHGNGIEDIFRNDPRVLYCSSFQHPFYPFSGADTKSSHIINIPLPAGTGSQVFQQKTAEFWFDKIKEFKPELIFFSAGFDAYIDDEMANLLLTENDYLWITENIKKIADQYCHGRIVSVLEGGYSLQGLKSCVIAHIQGLNKAF
ncbi:Histone deacetylase-like amidohydrolase [Legionella drozanskii LLAP-1]|uniref:Histone deacetylase-like amidohydrolase n=2 Tax=Legionella drozanskii TaxID=96228 RepID=A0A0W0T0Y4_9GAMM|nr:Histone deacetylase-like amidohydrolase [Legionella drozanskii LLAP-1]